MKTTKTEVVPKQEDPTGAVVTGAAIGSVSGDA